MGESRRIDDPLGDLRELLTEGDLRVDMWWLQPTFEDIASGAEEFGAERPPFFRVANTVLRKWQKEVGPGGDLHGLRSILYQKSVSGTDEDRIDLVSEYFVTHVPARYRQSRVFWLFLLGYVSRRSTSLSELADTPWREAFSGSETVGVDLVDRKVTLPEVLRELPVDVHPAIRARWRALGGALAVP